MRCPRCDSELSGRPQKCDSCQGCWVTVADVARTVKSDALSWTAAGTSKITCPECYAPMQAITLRDVHLDRCAKHGVWFDIGEITDLLQKTGKPSTRSKAAEGAGGVGSAILEVVGTVFDIVT